jgi:GH24 family phage-related lysozyme (muramidase)
MSRETTNETVNYSEMYGDQSNKFIAKEHKNNELDNLYYALYRLSNATNAVVSFIKTNCGTSNQFKSHRTRKINWPQ